MPEKKEFERLSKTVVPSNYDLFLEPDLEKFAFNGSEDISIQVTTIKIGLCQTQDL